MELPARVRLGDPFASSRLITSSVLRKANMPLSSMLVFSTGFASLADPDSVRSSHALDVLAEVYGEEDDKRAEAELVSVVAVGRPASDGSRVTQVLDLLAHRFDPIRANYWEYRKTLLGHTGTGAVGPA